MSRQVSAFFFFNDPATPEIYTLSLHDALPISLYLWDTERFLPAKVTASGIAGETYDPAKHQAQREVKAVTRSEEHTSELQSRLHLVCRLLLEKKKNH